MSELGDDCLRCGELMQHYLSHVCKGCTCTYHEVHIPGEPHIPGYLDMEPNPDCPVHREDVTDDIRD